MVSAYLLRHNVWNDALARDLSIGDRFTGLRHARKHNNSLAGIDVKILMDCKCKGVAALLVISSERVYNMNRLISPVSSSSSPSVSPWP